MSERLLFPEPMQFRGEAGFARAVATAARQARTTSAEWMRRAVRDRLAAEGVTLPPLDAPAEQKAA